MWFLHLARIDLLNKRPSIYRDFFYDFYKKTSVIKMSKQGLEKIGRSAIQLANYEGLFAHSQSIRIRIS